MNRLTRFLPVVNVTLVVVFVVLLVLRTRTETGALVVASSAVLTFFCFGSAVHLLGPRLAVLYLALAVAMGWFAEQMGASYGWFFGAYTYTHLLGPTLGKVPIIVPFMWFTFVYNAGIMANLIVWRAPVDDSRRPGDMVLVSLLTAAIVTAYDLGLDPYMVNVVKAWRMTDPNGSYFGETAQGFVGWMTVSFIITGLFRFLARQIPPMPATRVAHGDALMPVVAYAGSMVFLACVGYPTATRSIVAVAMGIPVLAAIAGWWYWRAHGMTQLGGTA